MVKSIDITKYPKLQRQRQRLTQNRLIGDALKPKIPPVIAGLLSRQHKKKLPDMIAEVEAVMRRKVDYFGQVGMICDVDRMTGAAIVRFKSGPDKKVKIEVLTILPK